MNRIGGDNIINVKLLRKIILLLACISLFFSISIFSDTYGKYLTQVEDESEIKIARWRILVNGDDVRNNSIANSTIKPTFSDNPNISDNVIAPGAEGYFDIEIDGTQADVSFKYEIIAKVNEESAVQDIIITGYQINNGELITEDLESISNIVSAKDTTKNIKVRIFIKWDDSENASMNNEADTNATYSSEAKMDIELKFTQVII